MVIYKDISTRESLFHVKLVTISVFLAALGQLVISSDRNPILSYPIQCTLPLLDTLQGHFRKSVDVLVEILDCGLWLSVNVVSCPPDELPFCANECSH